MHKFFGAVVIWIGIALWAGIGAGLAQPSENGLRPIATTTPYSSSASTPSSAAATRYFLPVVAQLQHAALPTSLPTPTAVPEGTATPAATSIAVNRRSPLGTNLPKLTNWEMLWTLDQAPLAGEWLTQCDESCGYTWNTGEQEQLVLDSDGWVISFGNNPAKRFTHVALAYFNGGASVVPAGDWTVLYEGEATVDYGFSPFVTEIRRAPGRDVLRISPSDDDTLLRIRISDINPNNHLRNLHLIPPGGICDNDPFLYAENAADCGAGTFQSFVDVYPNVRFHPLMLQTLQHYQVLRFMQWQGIVDDLEAKPWEERSLLGDALWGTGWGVSPPIELIFELSNLLHADPWVHLPFWADDSYTRRFAELAFSQLDPARNLYLEYANEVWNNAYPYSLYGSQIEEWAQQRWPNVFHPDGSPFSGYTKRMNFVGMRSAQICAIWHEVWGAAAERLRCIMPGGPWEFPAHEALSCPFYAAETGKPNCAEQMWAVAAAPYFGGYLDDNDNAAGGFFDQLAAWASSGPAGLDSSAMKAASTSPPSLAPAPPAAHGTTPQAAPPTARSKNSLSPPTATPAWVPSTQTISICGGSPAAHFLSTTQRSRCLADSTDPGAPKRACSKPTNRPPNTRRCAVSSTTTPVGGQDVRQRPHPKSVDFSLFNPKGLHLCENLP